MFGQVVTYHQCLLLLDSNPGKTGNRQLIIEPYSSRVG